MVGLAACHRPVAGPPETPAHPAAARGEAAYRHPPSPRQAVFEPNGRVRIEGDADPGAQVRLAAPHGGQILTVADRDGRWRLVLPQGRAVRIFGLAMIEDGRVVQSEGYLAIAPGMAVQLRGGDAARVLSPTPGPLAIQSVDFDRKGAAVVGGHATPGAEVALSLDGGAVGHVQAGPHGGFAFDLGEPLTPGSHRLAVTSDGRAADVVADATFAAPPPTQPVAGGAMPGGWRIAWTPPGGGVQTTLIFSGTGAR